MIVFKGKRIGWRRQPDLTFGGTVDRPVHDALVWACCLALLTAGAAVADSPALSSARLTLPREVVAVAGLETAVYFDNIVLMEQPGKYRFQVDCDLGEVDSKRWSCRPSEGDLGTHRLTLTVRDASGTVLESQSTNLRVLPAAFQADSRFQLLIVGDSLTHATAYPNEIARLFADPANPTCRMLGTHQPASAKPGVAHEGYGGWTWQRFVTRYEPEPDGTHRKRSSPFVFLDDQSKPQLDVSRYIREACGGTPPDIVVFMLGINDCFSADPDSIDAIDQRIDTMFGYADTLLDAFGRAAPQARLGICLTTPPNARQEAFEANYQDRYRRWGWKRIQHRLVERQLEHYADRAADRLFVIPTHLNLDPVDGYPANNGVHPNAAGYRQIGQTIFASLAAVLTASPLPGKVP